MLKSASGRRILGAAAMLLLTALLLAGCGGKPSQTVTLPSGESIKVEEKVEAGTGFVHGLVGDDALYLLDDVFVRLVGSVHETRTGLDGTFLLANVEPGIYVLEGSKKDYATVQTTVEVNVGEVAKSVLLLQRLPSSDPFCQSWHHASHLDASFGVFLTVGGNATRMRVDLDGQREPESVIIESIWEGEIVGATEEPLGYNLEVLRARDWYIEGRGPNPLYLAVDGRTIPPNEPELQVDVTPNQAGQVVLLAEGELYVHVFYNEPAPPGWSFFDGDDWPGCGR